MRPIVWLASYPKSGNTWFRAFLTNFLRDGEEPAGINNFYTGPIASARHRFDEAVGFDSSELTFDEIDALRPEVYLQQAQEADATLYYKIHDAYSVLPDGRPLIPPEATGCALYFVRNPLDVAVSFAHHDGSDTFDAVIARMADEGAAFCAMTAFEPNQLRQRLLTWSGHVLSWTGAAAIRVLVLRYEDMKRDPDRTFGAAVRFLGLAGDIVRLRKAIRFASFEELRRQEEKNGFPERAPRAKSFFRKGEVGSWRTALTAEQASRIIDAHAEVMRRFGYLDQCGNPIF